MMKLPLTLLRATKSHLTIEERERERERFTTNDAHLHFNVHDDVYILVDDRVFSFPLAASSSFALLSIFSLATVHPHPHRAMHIHPHPHPYTHREGRDTHTYIHTYDSQHLLMALPPLSSIE